MDKVQSIKPFLNTIASGNRNHAAIAFADELGGHRTVADLNELADIPDVILSKSGINENNDAIGQQWYVRSEKSMYQLDSWENRHSTSGWSIVNNLPNVTNDAQVKRTEMGVANGVATLDESGKVPSSQLPSYVDDVLEGRYVDETTFNNLEGTPYSPLEKDKIYVDTNTNNSYRWSGSILIQVATMDPEKYHTELPDDYQSDQTIGTFKNVKVSDLKNKTYNEIFDEMLFPDKVATIVNPSITYVDPTYTNRYEVGTNLVTIGSEIKISMTDALSGFNQGKWEGKGTGVMSDSTYGSIKSNFSNAGPEGYSFIVDFPRIVMFGPTNTATIRFRYKKAANTVLTYKGNHNSIQPTDGNFTKSATIIGSMYIGHNATKYTNPVGDTGDSCSKVTDLISNNESVTKEGLNTSFDFYAEFDEASTTLPNTYASVWIPTSISYIGGESKEIKVNFVAKAYNPVSSAADKFDQNITFNKVDSMTTRTINGTTITYTRWTRNATVKSDIKLHLTISLS